VGSFDPFMKEATGKGRASSLRLGVHCAPLFDWHRFCNGIHDTSTLEGASACRVRWECCRFSVRRTALSGAATNMGSYVCSTTSPLARSEQPGDPSWW